LEEYQCHYEEVKGILIDNEETALISIGSDGKLVIKSFHKDLFDDMEINFTCGSLTAICFCSEFTLSKFSFYIGLESGKVILFEQGWFSYEETTLFEHSTPITSISKHNNYLYYSDTNTIYFTHIPTKQQSKLFTHSKLPAIGVAPCYLWDDNTLYITWYNTLISYHIEHNERLIIRRKILIEEHIGYCGITLFANRILVYGVEDKGQVCKHVVKIFNKKSELLYKQVVDKVNHNDCKLWEYKAVIQNVGKDFVVYNPEVVYIIHPITVVEKIYKLRKDQNYGTCLELATLYSNELDKEILSDVQNEYIEYLLAAKKYIQAVDKMQLARIVNKENWLNWINRFKQVNQLDLIFEALLKSQDKLPKDIYEIFPSHFLDNNQFDKLEDCLRKFLPKLNLSKVLNEIKRKIAVNPELELIPEVKRCQLLISKAIDNVQLVIPLCVELKDKDIFKLLSSNRELEVLPLIVELTEIDPLSTADLIIRQRRVDIEKVIKKLKEKEKALYLFLDSAFTFDANSIFDYHPLLPSLYIKYNPKKLLEFLKTSGNYTVVDTLKICEEKRLLAELVFLHDKLNNKKEALNLILEVSKNSVVDACKYIIEKDAGNQELWEVVLSYCKNDRKKLTELFNYLEYFGNPESITEAPELHIELGDISQELRFSLRNMEIRSRVYQASSQIAGVNLIRTMTDYIKFRCKGYQIKQSCAVCKRRLNFTTKGRKADNLLIFFCGHHMHSACYSLFNKDRLRLLLKSE